MPGARPVNPRSRALPRVLLRRPRAPTTFTQPAGCGRLHVLAREKVADDGPPLFGVDGPPSTWCPCASLPTRRKAPTEMTKKTAPQIAPHAPRAGIITDITFTLAGEQRGTVDGFNIGTYEARVVLRLGKLRMTFTSAQQAQHVRGYFAMARQGMLLAPQFAPMPRVELDEHTQTSIVAVEWVATPTGSASIEQFRNPRSGKVSNYVALRIGNLTFRILDRIALDRVTELLAKTHGLACVAFPSGEEFTVDPTAADWHERKDVRFARMGTGWVPTR